MNSLDRFFSLSPFERAAHYREMADLIGTRAKSATMQETQDGYAVIAAEWLSMAEKLEAEHGKAYVVVQSELACRLKQA